MPGRSPLSMKSRSITHWRDRSGVALVIILAFLVLLSGVVVAFFSRAITERQVSNSSANQTRADILARSAAEIVIGDMKQEIVNGSTAATPNPQPEAGAIYFPTTAVNMVPRRDAAVAALPAASAIPNLIRVSAVTAPPSPATATCLASNVGSTAPAVNGRSISTARWNSHYLIPRLRASSTTIDSTPIDSFATVAPSWVMVTNQGPAVLTSPASSVIGRYAYAVYDEGGLLDMNVAGYPDPSPTPAGIPIPAYKGSLAFANLAYLPTGSTSTLGQAPVDAVAGWRNYASAQPAGSLSSGYNFDPAAASRYYKSVLTNMTGFLSVSPVPYPSPATAASRTDQVFGSRQELLRFRRSTGFSQNALQYMGTFSRDINQPSLAPLPVSSTPDATHRPAISGGDGGNDASGGEASINPSFLMIRAPAGLQRFDSAKPGGLGNKAAPGEPLVKQRFALNRLAWLTYKGPSAGNMNDPAVQQTITSLGGNPADASDPIYRFVAQGTAQNIYNYFGLSWVPVATASGTIHVWAYSHAGMSPLSSAPAASAGAAIKTLSEVAGANREPDFIELLKATINAGAIAKSATDPAPTAAPFERAQWAKDTSLDYALIQIAANIIDQSDADGYPTLIRFAGGNGTPVREFRGVENLPYFYRSIVGLVQAAMPAPAPTQDWIDGVSPGYDTYPLPGLTNTGFYVALLEPELWNPHDQNASLGFPRPQSFRFVVDSAPMDADGNPSASAPYNKVAFKAQAAQPNDRVYSDQADSPPKPATGYFATKGYQQDPVELTADTTALEFDIPLTSANPVTWFREPTLLLKPDIPAGSQLRIGANNYLKTKFAGTEAASYFPGDGVKALNNITSGITSDNKPYLGIYLGVAPLRWVKTEQAPGARPQVYSAYQQRMFMSADNGDSAVTFRVQCKGADGNWATYDEKYARFSTDAGSLIVDSNSNPDTEASVGNRASSGAFSFGNRAGGTFVADPRTDRFGMVSGRRDDANAWVLDSGRNPPSTIPWLDQSANVLGSLRPDAGVAADAGYLDAAGPVSFWGLPRVPGWYPASGGKPGWIMGGGHYRIGYLAQNNPAANPGKPYFADPDGVVRRAMGAYWSPSTNPASLGLPMYKTQGAGAAASQNRPILLNRPFRTVSEIGYVFSDTPWRNMDMFTPESGFAGMLDVFCTSDAGDANAMTAGKVNLNTRQAPVLQTIVAGAYKDELGIAAVVPGASASTLAATVAKALVTRTNSATGGAPLINLSELVGRWAGNQQLASGGIDGSSSYVGFSSDLSTANVDISSAIASSSAAGSEKSRDQVIQRFREAAIRALSGSGQTRVWNLMIDVVAQSGRYPPGAAALNKFVVEGEQRYWVHVAIDRLTGQVIDKQVEVVKE